MTAPDPTTDDVTAIAQHLAMSYGSHVSPPEGGSDWRAAESLMPWLAERDARVRAEALREAADTDEPEFHIEVALGGSGYVRSWLRERADRVERGESS